MDQGRVLSVDLPSGQRVSIILSNASEAVTSSDNLLAYRPCFADHHGSGLAAVFLNLKVIFPCMSVIPQCGVLTHEDDGFFGGRSFIQAADIGNHFRIFSSSADIMTYGLALQDCPEFTPQCIPDLVSVSVLCLLPRSECA